MLLAFADGEKEDDVSRTGKITVAVIAAVLAVLIGWDIYVAVNDVGGDTISEIVLNTSYSHPSIPLALGIIVGHLVWPRERPLFWRKPWTALLAGAVAVVLFVLESWFSWRIVPLAPLLPGILLGHWLWPQRRPSLTSS